MDRREARNIIEAVLFVSGKSVTIDTLKDVLGGGIEPTAVRELVDELNREYAASSRSFSIQEIAGGFQMMTDPRFSAWIAKLYKRPPDRLSGAALETLAIIAYKQPLTRAEIEAIRGVNVDGVVHTLEERGLIRTRGRKDVPGRPILYGTTGTFLQHFGLKSLEELPRLKEFKEEDLDFVKERESAMVVDTATGRFAREKENATDNGAGHETDGTAKES